MAELFTSASNLSFSYPQQITPLFEGLSLTLPRGWTGIVGPNGAGKTTLARLLSGEISPERGSVRSPASRCYCAQESREAPERLEEILASTDGEALRVMRLLGIEGDWPARWDSLSYGERKRAQLAVALALDPELLVLDEPTNHLDADAVMRIRTVLSSFRGIGLLISHDRDLLDSLCERCVFFENGRITVRPGGVTEGLREAARERESAKRERENAGEELARLRREAHARRVLADSARARLSGRRLPPKDSDGRGKRRLARVSGKDAVGGKLLRQMEKRIEAAEERVRRSGVSADPPAGVTISASESRRDFLFSLEAAVLPLGEDRRLSVPELSMRPGDRIALTGPNGSGKSTLVRAIAESSTAAGRDSLLYLPQELPEEMIGDLRGQLAALDSKRRGEVLSAVARLGSDPVRVAESGRPSPGEARKLFLALALAGGVELIILDEPTNHMDLPSILCVEEALAACPASLLLVTHDLRFAERLAAIRWIMAQDPARPGDYLLERP